MNDTHHTQNATILIVDDEDMVLTSLESLLAIETDHEVMTFTSPVQALESVEEAPVDLVISDYLMPEMNGIDFLSKFKDIHPDVTRILLTAYADKQNAIRAINDLGLYRYIEKPWDNEQLLVDIKNGLERRELISDLEFQVEKEHRIRNVFQRYVPEQIISEVLNPDNESALMENSDEWTEAFDHIMGELEQKQKIEHELQIAREIQEWLLPQDMPQIEGFEVAAKSVSAREVSGDFYDYLNLGNDLGIVLADVTGKSVKAGMVASMTDGVMHTVIRERKDAWNSPSKILAELNLGLQSRLIRGMYTAMSLGIVQPEQKRLIFSNAGMPYPVLKRGREVRELAMNGMPLGLVSGAEYEDMNIDLELGDVVIFCSDGFIEAENEAGEMYQTERLLDLVAGMDTAASAEGIIEAILADVSQFAGSAEQYDDMTIVVIKRTGE